jgi:TonB family protein
MKRELLYSFVGHLVLFAVVGAVTMTTMKRDRRRPQVFTVRLVNPGEPMPVTPTDRAQVVTPKPKTQVKPEPKPEQPKPKPPEQVVRRQGLGARIEGAQALGYSYYLNIILSKIAENWYNPYAGQSREFHATVYFVIERDGTVKDVKLEEGSGDAAYDQSCTRAMLVTTSLPPLPPEFKGDELKLHLEFEYKP